jgi:hypothetical protein
MLVALAAAERSKVQGAGRSGRKEACSEKMNE